jgi:putative protease
LRAFNAGDLDAVDEVVLDVGREPESVLRTEIDELARRVGPERVRLALPAILRTPDGDAVRRTAARLLSDGWRRWEISNLSGFVLLSGDGLDVSADWPLYAMNRLAVSQLLDMGIQRVTLSPEDGRQNLSALLREFGACAAVVVYQDTPLLISETCAFRDSETLCRGGGECGSPETLLTGKRGATFVAVRDRCRTVLLHERPFALAQHVRELADAGAVRLRLDFVWRRYTPEQVLKVWTTFQAGTALAGRDANFARGLA